MTDETGNRYGRVVVFRMVESCGDGARWYCFCDCGRSAVIRGRSLRDGNTKSCGCLLSDTARHNGYVHGPIARERSHAAKLAFIVARGSASVERYLSSVDFAAENMDRGIDPDLAICAEFGI